MQPAYIHTEQVHNFSAAEEIMPVLLSHFSPKRILDVGCGTGTWLKVAQTLGVPNVLGLDGSYVPLDQLKIDPELFRGIDLREPFDIQQQFDLVMSLEVAEHLPESSAKGFVESLTKHGRVIVFSAAIPDQGGQYHINEQTPGYWKNLFEAEGYRLYDVFRMTFWDNPRVDFWYKQNMFLYVHQDTSLPEPWASISSGFQWPENTIHPGLLAHKVTELRYAEDQVLQLRRAPGVKQAARTFWLELLGKLGLKKQG